MTWRGKVGEILRFFSNRWLRYAPTIRRTFAQAASIIVVSPQTAALVPKKLRGRVSEVLAISYDEPVRFRDIHPRQSSALKMLFAARAIDWKGLHIGLPAVARAVEAGADLNLTVVGEGPALGHWRSISDDLGISARIAWLNNVPRPEFMSSLASYDVLFFPSLHDSGGLVVLESLANGVPVVCLDAGGPGRLVDPSCGIKVQIHSREQVVEDLAAALVRLHKDESLRLSLARNAQGRIAGHFMLANKIGKVMKSYPTPPSN